MEEKIKEIVSIFTKIPAGEIGPATAVDRQAVKSSILLHRMYARLAEEGLVVENYTSIRTFSDLVGSHKAVNGVLNGTAAIASVVPEGNVPVPGTFSGGVGIDIEELSNFPHTHDFRKDEFYMMNFTPSEIAYCILQSDPYASFAGLFSAKEAIVKADEKYRSRAFNTIGITHSGEGKPFYEGFHLSIAHAGSVAVAVAVPSAAVNILAAPLQQSPSVRQSKAGVWLGLLALILSILAIILGFKR